MSNQTTIENQKLIAEILIGCALYDNVAADYIAQKLSPEDFYYSQHREMLRNIINAVNDGQEITMNRIAGDVDDGTAMIDYIAGRHVECNYEAYIEAAIEISNKRKLSILCQQFTDESLKGESTLIETMSKLENGLSNIKTSLTQDNAPESIQTVAREWLKELEQRINNGSVMKGTPTGYDDLDGVLSGLQSALYILAGRPGSGKSAFALNLALNVAKQGKHVLFVSLEMTRSEIMDRSTANMSNLFLQDILNGFNNKKSEQSGLMKSVTKTIAGISQMDFTVWDNSDLTIGDLVLECQRLHREMPLGLIIVDYLGLMTRTDDEITELGAITRSLKNLSSKIETPVVALHQVNRSVEKRENKRPRSSDLRGSGKIEENANVVMFTYREDYYEKNPAMHNNKLEIIVDKNRAGAKGIVTLRSDLSKMQINNIYTPFDEVQS